MEALERVQKNFARMLPGLEGINYRERLDSWIVFSVACVCVVLIYVLCTLPALSSHLKLSFPLLNFGYQFNISRGGPVPDVGSVPAMGQCQV